MRSKKMLILGVNNSQEGESDYAQYGRSGLK